MPLDRISDEIAHFIGLFHLEVEELRLRLEYEKFRFKHEGKEREPQDLPELEVNISYTMKGFDPKLDYKAAASPTAALPFQSLDDVPGDAAPVPMSPNGGSEVRVEIHGAASGWQFSWPPFVAVPNSIIVVIGQVTELWDSDVVLVTGEIAFIAPEVLVEQFLEKIELAQGLSAFGKSGVDIATVPKAEAVLALADQIAAFTPEDGAAEVQLLLRAEAAQGAYVNGVLVEPPSAGPGDAAGSGVSGPEAEDEIEEIELLPDFLDLLPAHLAEEHAASEEEAEKDPFTIPPDGTTGFESKYALDPGHKVVTGANLATNETAITQVWVDAPVIAVAGDAVRLDVISQVNVMADAANHHGDAALASKMLNAVSVEYESSIDPDDPPPEAESGVFPQDWTVVSVAADLVAVNWVKQYIFASDFDQTEITITAAKTYISTGENVIGNGVQLVELGFNYDLILIGGNMVTLNVIDQINVLLDGDVVDGRESGPAILQAGDNLQYNRAELKQTGLDEMTEMQDSFRDALQEMAEGKKTLAREVAKDARFEGKAALKALHIEGDLIKANIVEQHNYIGDSDQIKLMLEDFLAANEAVHLVTGSNAQLNAARIHDIGLDSEVMVGGDVYSDALIYQAQFMDPDAPPNGVGMVPLANEAVAFLADDMLTPASDYEPGMVMDVSDHPASSDVMQTVIS